MKKEEFTKNTTIQKQHQIIPGSLFRGEDIETGKYIYGYLSFIYGPLTTENNKKARIYDQENAQAHDVHTDTVAPYTGINDMRGTPIFRGDIIDYGSDGLCEIVYKDGYNKVKLPNNLYGFITPNNGIVQNP